MTLKELIIKYRHEHNLSQRRFAEKCSLSNGYISMVEKGINPNTRQPITPTLPVYKKLANGMNMTLNELFASIDDENVYIAGNIKDPPNRNEKSPDKTGGNLTEGEKHLLELFRKIPENEQSMVIDMIAAALNSRK